MGEVCLRAFVNLGNRRGLPPTEASGRITPKGWDGFVVSRALTVTCRCVRKCTSYCPRAVGDKLRREDCIHVVFMSRVQEMVLLERNFVSCL